MMISIKFLVCGLVLLVCLRVEAWHGYNFSFSRLEDRSDCPTFRAWSKPYTDEFINRLSLWPNLTSSFDKEYGETLYGSQEGLEIIWKNQNPDDCSKAKFLVSGGWPYGFGSRIHMEGMFFWQMITLFYLLFHILSWVLCLGV
jgi:hypothetical protein